MGTIADRYISSRFLGYFFGGLIVLITLYVAISAMSEFNDVKVSPLVLAKYYGFSLPGIVNQFIPAAALIGTIFTLMELNRSNELTALFSLGNSLARISAPILFWVSIISVGFFIMGDRLLPLMNQKRNYVLYVEIKKQPGLYSTVKTDKIWYRSANILFNLKTLDPDTRQAQGATFYYFDENWDLLQLITAKAVQMADSTWTLREGMVTLFRQDSSFPLNQSFHEKIITINEDSADLQNSNSSDVMTIADLRRFIRKNKEAGLDTVRYEVDYHSKFGFAFASFVMAFLGVPFSVQLNRSGGRMVGIGICMGLALAYWTLYSSGLTLGRHGAIPPMAAAWIANLSMISVTFFVLVRLRK
jgi:lipopolysaccharide export system permease protein